MVSRICGQYRMELQTIHRFSQSLLGPSPTSALTFNTIKLRQYAKQSLSQVSIHFDAAAEATRDRLVDLYS